MKSPITNQPSLKEAGLRRHLTHANAAVAGAAAILLLGMTAVAGGNPPACSVQIRPIEDFLEAQGTPVGPAELRSIGWTDPQTERFVIVDFTGFANQWIEEESGGAASLGTETKGKIIERRLPDGRAEVTVLLHTRNALTWVMAPWAFDPYGDDLVFGHRAQDVLDGADPALGESFLMWVYISPAPGAAVPDLFTETVLGPPTVEMVMLSFKAHAKGTLREAFGVPDETPGRAQITEIGLFRPGKEPRWLAEQIKLKVVGR